MTGHYETAAEDDNGNGGFGSGGSDNFACDVRVRELCVLYLCTYTRKRIEERENNSAFGRRKCNRTWPHHPNDIPGKSPESGKPHFMVPRTNELRPSKMWND